MKKLAKPPRHPDFDTHGSSKKWQVKKFVAALRSHQHSKCAYCEDHTFDGDMDHYRPKGRIDELLNPDLTIDYEYAGLPNLDKKRMVKIIRTYGYPWLSNVWGNYLYSCKTCNQRYKKCLFPVSGARKTKANKTLLERPLLLNPSENINPFDHLKFDYFGIITPRNNSKRGLATILTCGLNRISLTQRRREFAEELEQLLIELDEAISDETVMLALTSLVRKGEDKKEFCGMIRILIKDILGMEYEELKRMIEEN